MYSVVSCCKTYRYRADNGSPKTSLLLMIWYVVATLIMTFFMPFMITPQEAILVHNFVGELIQRRSLAQDLHSVKYPPTVSAFWILTLVTSTPQWRLVSTLTSASSLTLIKTQQFRCPLCRHSHTLIQISGWSRLAVQLLQLLRMPMHRGAIH
jgi:hypothetical protein